MPGFLSGMLWKLVGGFVVVLLIAGLWWRGSHYEKRAVHAEAALDQAIDVNEANVKIFENYRKVNAKLRELVARGATKKVEIRRKSDERRKVIIDALPQDDGPLAPVLRDTLDGLPKPEGDDAGPDRAASNAAGGAFSAHC